MKNDNINSPAVEIVVRFLESVKRGDSQAFWKTLDKKGQGYFIGLWFYAMETMNVQTIIGLTHEKEFLDGVLGPIMGALRESIKDLLDSPEFGEVTYRTPQCAAIKVSQADKAFAMEKKGDPEDDSIPLVLELCDEESGNADLTCWKIDTLQCFQLNKGTH